MKNQPTKDLSVDEVSCGTIDINQFIPIEQISLGQFGEVVKVKKKNTNEIYAMKVFPIEMNPNSLIIQDLQNNFSAISQINHPAIIKLFYLFKKGFKKENIVAVVTKFYKNGSLSDIVTSKKKSSSSIQLSNTKKLINIYGIASGMQYLHSINIYHGNLKLTNILLDDHLYPQICHFLYPKYLKKEMASDTISEEFESDVYSFGQIVLEIIKNEFITEISNEIPSYYKTLADRCMAKEPKDRPTFGQIVEEMKANQGFINSPSAKKEFVDYIKFIDDQISRGKPIIENNNNMNEEEKGSTTKSNYNNDAFTEKLRLDASRGDVECMQKLAFMYLNGNRVLADKKEAAKYFKMSADKGNTDSMYNYALMLQKGDGIECDKNQAAKYFKKAADMNHAKSMYKYASMLLNGEVNEYEDKGELKFYDSLADKYLRLAQKQDEVDAIFTLGKIHYKGIQTEMNWGYAAEYFKIAADLGMVESMFNYALMLSNGEGVKIDKKEAAKYYKKAADNGQINSMYNYATMLRTGDGIDVNKKEASIYYKKAADKGHVNSMYNYGIMLYEGNGIEQDKKEAGQYLKKAADVGQVNSMYKYAVMLNKGDGIEMDKKEAFRYFKNAADKGHILSMRYLSLMLKNGDGVEIDVNEAIKYLNKANDEESKSSKIMHYLNKFFDPKKYEKQSKFPKKSNIFKFFNVVDRETGENRTIKQSCLTLDDFNFEKLFDFQREIRIISSIDHPSILKYYGYCPVNFSDKNKPTILSEGAPEFSLLHIFDENIELNDTKKLIIVYGIASAMAFLHSHDIIHRDLTPHHIFLDKFFYPKLTGFRISVDNVKSVVKDCKFKGYLMYFAPERLRDLISSKASDVYSFALIVYQLMTNDQFFENIEIIEDLVNAVVHKESRPEFKKPIFKCYRDLIESCWSQDPKKRPTFNEIIEQLQTNEEFLTENVNREEYYKYIESIKEAPKTYKPNKGIKQLNELIKSKRNKFKIDITYINLRGPTDPNIRIYYRDCKRLNHSARGFHYDVFTIKHKETNILYDAQIYSIEIYQFTRSEILSMCREIKLISRLNHPAILKFVSYNFNNFSNGSFPVIITEKCNRKSRLSSIITGSFCDDTKKLIILYGIASAMAYLHSHNIIHRDLKAENIYLDNKQFPKLYEFQLSREIQPNTTYKSHNLKGTLAYLAPEVLKNLKYSKASDVYAFSILVYEILFEKLAFDDEYKNPKKFFKDICEKGIRPKINTPIPSCYRKLIEKCWSEDPNERPTFDDILIELKNNSDFITDTVDEEQFREYVKFIDEFPISFEPAKRIEQIDKILDTKLDTFHDFQINNGIKNIHTTCQYISFDGTLELRDYEQEKEIGSGCFYSVSLIKNKETDEQYIAKTPTKKIISFFRYEIINFTQELNIILQLNHPSILKLVGYSPIDFNEENNPVIVTEYARKGSLRNVLVQGKNNKEWTYTKKLINIYGIASAMQYLHSHNIIHRDLKPENIFLDELYYPKLSGFHLSIENPSTLDDGEISIKGTPAYLSPEILNKKKYSKSSDVYSFALVVYEIMTNQKPFHDLISPKEILHEVCEKYSRPLIDDSVPDCFKKIIEKCWSQNPNERPTFEMILSELKTNPEFITELVDENEYHQYIKYIESAPITFDQSRKIHRLKEFVQTRTWLFQNLFSGAKFKGNYETETDNILFDLNVLNIENYENNKLIFNPNKRYKTNIYEIIEKKTNSPFFATVSSEGKHIDFRELSIVTKINHQSFLKYIGYSPNSFNNLQSPTIIYENASNGSLSRLLELEKNNEKLDGWNDTKKLIILYGIASGMSYLHSMNVVHSELSPDNIFLDDFLFPKIFRLDLSKKVSEEYDLPNYSGFFRTVYHPPEVLIGNYYETSYDVYSFAMTAYRLITNEFPFDLTKNKNLLKSIQVFKLIDAGKRPEFKHPIPNCYRNLIEKCWAQDPKERPTFEEIASHLRSNKEFITDEIDKEEYENYIKYVESYQKAQLMNDLSQVLNDFIDNKNCPFRKVKIDFTKMKKRMVHFSVDMGSADLNKYEKKSKIGSGAFGNVYIVTNKETDEIAAAKISIYEIDQCNEDIIMNLTREVDIISRLNHPAILKFIGYSPNNFTKKPKPVILTEFASGGSLDMIIEMERKSCGHHQWNDTKRLINLYGIAAGMKYLHKHKIFHRDLKPANILLDENLYPKIADFGLSKDTSPKEDSDDSFIIPSGFKGTYAYSSPEIVLEYKYSEKGDVYAFGIIAYEMMTNQIPFENYNFYQVIKELKEGIKLKFEIPIPYCYRHLIQKCVSYDDIDRPTFDQICQILETNRDFITPNVDEDEYTNYIFSIKDDEQEEQGQQQQQSSISNDEPKSEKVNYNEKDDRKDQKAVLEDQEMKVVEEENETQRIEEIEEKAQFPNGFLLNLDDFKRETMINKNDAFKSYTFIGVNDGCSYLGQMSMFSIPSFTSEDIAKLTSQIDFLLHASHPCLLKFIGFSPIDFKGNRKPVVVTENAANGDLSSILEISRKQQVGDWNEMKKQMCLFGIASAMRYLHQHNFVYSSLDPSNIFLDELLSPKLGFSNISRQFIKQSQLSHRSTTGFSSAPIYEAPEVITEGLHTKKSDVYSFAIIAYEILADEKPFDGKTASQVINEVVFDRTRPELKDSIPSCYRKLIEKCWACNPDERLSFDEIVSFLKNDEEVLNETRNKEDMVKYMKFIEINKH